MREQHEWHRVASHINASPHRPHQRTTHRPSRRPGTSGSLRAVVLVTVALQLAFWLSVPSLPYTILLGAAFAAGLLMVPAGPVTRQAIAAMTMAEQRRAAFALEAVQSELSYIVGPAVVVLGAAKLSRCVVAWGVGIAIAVGGAGIGLLNPPLRAENEADPGDLRDASGYAMG